MRRNLTPALSKGEGEPMSTLSRGCYCNVSDAKFNLRPSKNAIEFNNAVLNNFLAL